MDASTEEAIKRVCRDLVIAVTHYGDHREVDQALGLFAEDAAWLRAGKWYRGLDEIRESYYVNSPTEIALHLICSTHVSVQGFDKATSVSYYMAISGDTGTPSPTLPLPLVPFSAGEWHDDFVRTERGWKFRQRATKRLFGPPGSGSMSGSAVT